MSELERALIALAAGGRVAARRRTLELRLEPAPRRAPRARARGRPGARRGRRSRFAVPQARSAILRFFHLGGVTVERVTTLPAAEERPLAVGLGAPVSRAEAEAVLGGPVALPRVNGEPQLYEREGVVSAVLATPEARAVERASARPTAGRC